MKSFSIFLTGVLLLLLLAFPGLEREVTIPCNVTSITKGYINGEFVSPQLTLEYQNKSYNITGTTWTLEYSFVGLLTDHVYNVRRHK